MGGVGAPINGEPLPFERKDCFEKGGVPKPGLKRGGKECEKEQCDAGDGTHQPRSFYR